jgi:hypothetical protein
LRTGDDAVTAISALWRKEQVPIEDGLFLADGAAYEVDVVNGRLRIGAPFDLDSLLAADPTWVASIIVTREVPIPDGLLCAGEGSYGSEGFFARLDTNRNLVWVVHFQESNPFTEISVHGNEATFTSTSGVSAIVNLVGQLPTDAV